MYFEHDDQYICDLCGNIATNGVTIIWMSDDDGVKNIGVIKSYLDNKGSKNIPDPSHLCNSCREEIKNIGKVHK